MTLHVAVLNFTHHAPSQPRSPSSPPSAAPCYRSAPLSSTGKLCRLRACPWSESSAERESTAPL